MKLKKFMKAADGHVIGGSEFLWKCYPNGRFMDISDIDGAHIGGCVFNSETNHVYEVSIEVSEDNVAFRWTDPEYVSAYRTEATERGHDPDIAWDEVYYTTVNNEEDILDLIRKIIHHTYVHSQVDKCSNSCASCSCNSATDTVADSTDDNNEYEVKVTVVQVLGVRAGSMEDAVTKATEFTYNMKPSIYPLGVSWLDKYDVKAEVTVSLNGDRI